MRWLLPLVVIFGCVTPGRQAPPRTSYDFGLAAAPLEVARPLAAPPAIAHAAAPDRPPGDGTNSRLAPETPSPDYSPPARRHGW